MSGVPNYEMRALEVVVETKDYWPKEGVRVAAGYENHQFIDCRGIDWSEAREIVSNESELLAAVFRDGADPEEGVDIIDSPIGELGTWGAVAVLNAAGCPTISSCAGHPEGERFPHVALFVRRERLPLLVQCVREAGLGLIADGDELVAFSNRGDGLHRFASVMLQRSAEWEALPAMQRDDGGPTYCTAPTYDVQTRIVVADRDYWVGKQIVAAGRAVNRDFVDLRRRVSWKDVPEILEEEAEHLHHWFCDGYAATTDWISSHPPETWVTGNYCDLDLGTAGAVATLNAAGCPTCWSCNGHDHGAPGGHPHVGFWARAAHLPLLRECAKAACVGLIESGRGSLLLFSDRADGLHSFAREMFRNASAWSRSIADARAPRAANRKTGPRSRPH